MTGRETTSTELQLILDGLLEQLAAIEHERWSHWQRYLHGKAERQPDGSLLLPAELVARWDAQMNTAYAALSEKLKESDRDQVRRYLPLIIDTFGAKTDRRPLGQR